ncbi:MAG: WD40 repeat domain-containing protein [Pirellulales bacterium]
MRWLGFALDGKRLIYVDHGPLMYFFDAEKEDAAPVSVLNSGDSPFAIPTIYDRERVYGKLGAIVVGWELSTGALIGSLDRGHVIPVIGLLSSVEGDVLASMDAAGDVFLWDTRAGKPLRRMQRSVKSRSTIASWDLTEDGKSLLVRFEPTKLRKYAFQDLVDPKIVDPKYREYTAPVDFARCYLDRAGDRVAAFSLVQGMTGWFRTSAFDKTGALISTPWTNLETPLRLPYDLSRDFRYLLASVGTNTTAQAIAVLDAETGKTIRRFVAKDKPGQMPTAQARLLDRANWAVDIRQNAIHVWDIDSGKKVWEYPQSPDQVPNAKGIAKKTFPFEIDESGRWASWCDGTEDNTILVHDLRTGKTIVELPTVASPIKSMRLLWGEKPQFVTAHDDGNIYVWDLPALVAAANSTPVAPSREIDALWKDLASEEPLDARCAAWDSRRPGRSRGATFDRAAGGRRGRSRIVGQDERRA